MLLAFSKNLKLRKKDEKKMKVEEVEALYVKY
jgi:hypothetical protein